MPVILMDFPQSQKRLTRSRYDCLTESINITVILQYFRTYFLEFISLLSKTSKIDQIHIRAVMLCMSKILKQAITDF